MRRLPLLLLAWALLACVAEASIRAADDPVPLRLTRPQRATGRAGRLRGVPEPGTVTIINGQPSTATAEWVPRTELTGLSVDDAQPAAAFSMEFANDVAASSDEELPLPAADEQDPAPPVNLVTSSALAGSQMPGEYIVMFKPEVQNAPLMAGDLQMRVASILSPTVGVAAASAGPAGNGTDDGSGMEVAPFAPFKIMAATQPSVGADGYVYPFTTATVKVEEGLPQDAVLSALQAQEGVQAIYPNTIVSITQSCYGAAVLAGYAPASFTVKWDRCMAAGRMLVFYGQRCGATMKSVQWTGAYVATIATGKAIAVCHVTTASPGYGLNTQLGKDIFGSCGVAPAQAKSLPTSICDSSSCVPATQLGSYRRTIPTTIGCGITARQAVYTGTTCGPGGRCVQWNELQLVSTTANRLGCQRARTTTNMLWNREWFGGCGVPPSTFKTMPQRVCQGTPPPPRAGNPTPAPARPRPPPAANPTPPPPSNPPPAPPPPSGSGKQLPRETLKSGERSLPNMARIGASSGGRVPIFDQETTVITLDTGGSNLADLNTKTGVAVLNGVVGAAWQDGLGHGTHVSGIIGGLNNGNGVYGTAPGVRVFPIKVLTDSGFGSMSDVLAGMVYATTNAALLKAGVINLSLGGGGPSEGALCAAVAAAVAAGQIVVAASGNEGTSLMASVPGACRDAVAVTAISTTTGFPAPFSKWLPTSADDARKRNTMAAPGASIGSTLSGGTYGVMSGTSMAAPHVAGVAARCFASGDCRLSHGARNKERFINAVWAKHDSDTRYRWGRAPATPVYNDRWYGPLVWANAW